MMIFRMLLMGLMVVVTLSACAQDKVKQLTRWEAYYAASDKPRAHVIVMPPQGSTVPMAKLIAQYVVEQLTKRKISAVVGKNNPPQGQYFVLTGSIEDNLGKGRKKFSRLIRWSLSDSQGRLISSHVEGIAATQNEWDFGAPRLLASIGISTAGPVAEMILVESKIKVPINPLRQGLLVDNLQGLSPQAATILSRAVRKALRASDIAVTGDPRQARFRLGGELSIQPAKDGYENVRIVWRVMTLDFVELGNAVQENRLRVGEINTRWAQMVPRVATAAAIGVEHVFGTRSGPAPGAPNRAKGLPPEIVLPGVRGRAPPPPR